MIDEPSSSEAPTRYLFPDLPDSPDQLDLSRLKPIVDRLEGIWEWYIFSYWTIPNKWVGTEFRLALEEIIPHVRAMAVNVGFLLSLAKKWRLDRFRDVSVQQSLGLTDETARRLVRMYFSFVETAGFEPKQFIDGDLEKLDAVAEELERRKSAEADQLSLEERHDLISAALPPPHWELLLGE